MEVLKVMNDPVQVDLKSTNVRMRIQILNSLADVLQHSTQGYLFNKVCQTCTMLLTSIQRDIEQLEERPVLEFIGILNKLYGTQASGQVNNLVGDLLKRVTDIVTEMAVENTDLVDANFSINYLYRVANSKPFLLSRDSASTFADIVRQKANNDEEF